MTYPTSRLVADLQALTLALHIGGLEGLRSGAVALGSSAPGATTHPEQHTPEGREERS